MPRASPSIASMICIVLIFGAPVMDPPGKLDRMRSTRVLSPRSSAVTVLINWCTVENVSTSNMGSARTVPGWATCAKSLRTKSTIIRFSARSLGFVAKSSRSSSSSAAVSPRTRVPLIGRDSIMPAVSTRKNRSGDVDMTATSPNRSNAPNGLGLLSRSCKYDDTTSILPRAVILLVKQIS